MKVRQPIWVIIGLTAIAYLVAILIFYFGLTSTQKLIIWDLHPPLIAADALWHGINPYSTQVTQAIQQLDYGRLATPEEDPQPFSYPLAVAILFMPLARLPLAWAQAIWLATLLLAAFGSFKLVVAIWNLKLRHLGLIGFLIGWFVFYPLAWCFILGQVSLLIFFILILAIWAIQRHLYQIGGVALGLLLLKPQIGFLLVPMVLIWAVARKQWLLVLNALGTMVMILVLPMFFVPTWIYQFIQRMGEYNSFSPFIAPAISIAQSCCASAAFWVAPLLITTIVGVFLFGAWLALHSVRFNDFLWAASFALIATTLVAPKTSVVNQVILLLPMMGLVQCFTYFGKLGGFGGIILVLFCDVSLWILAVFIPVSSATVLPVLQHQVLSPVIPVTLGLLWVFLRQRLVNMAAVDERG
jgi:hypothetical protein